VADFGKVLSSPIVWIGGAGLGLVLLMSRGNTSASPSGAVAAMTPQYLNASVQMNSAALGAQVDLAQVSADLGKAKMAADVTSQSLYYGYLKNQADNNTLLSGKQMETQAGITNAIIASGTAIQVDRQQNAAKLGMAYVDANKSAHTDNANVSIARYNYKAQKAVAKSSMIGNIFGSAAKVATAFA